jgi:hypothetical protein
MAWVAFDRMIRGVEQFRLDGPVDRWRAIRKQITDEVLTKGFDAERQHVHPGVRVARAGRGAAADPAGAVPALGRPAGGRHRRRGEPGAARGRAGAALPAGRRRSDDGLPGGEGAFLACSFWLADALHGIGRHDEATELFEPADRAGERRRAAGRGVRPAHGAQVGNTPQAFSHLALINAARHLSGARSAAPDLRMPRVGRVTTARRRCPRLDAAMSELLPTAPYRGTRDFLPAEMSVREQVFSGSTR